MKHAPKNLPPHIKVVDLNLVVPNVYINKGDRKFVIESLVKDKNLSRGAELGLRKGATMSHVLATCPNLHMIGVDLWEAQPDNTGPENYVDWNFNKLEKIARYKLKKFPGRATIHKMTTNEASKLVEDKSLDFIFIDADHSEEGVRSDIEHWSPKVKDNGFILGHDVAWESVYGVLKEKFRKFLIASDQVWIAKKGDLL